VSRLSLLEALRDGPLTVTTLVETTGLTQVQCVESPGLPA
jgi:hypothetical protein